MKDQKYFIKSLQRKHRSFSKIGRGRGSGHPWLYVILNSISIVIMDFKSLASLITVLQPPFISHFLRASSNWYIFWKQVFSVTTETLIIWWNGCATISCLLLPRSRRTAKDHILDEATVWKRVWTAFDRSESTRTRS